MKSIHRTTITSGLCLILLFLILGTATAGCISSEAPATYTGLKQVPHNITGVFTTISGIAYDSASGEFAANNPGIVYNVMQYDRLFTTTQEGSGSPLFFTIDDKYGRHFFSHRKNGNSTLFRSGILESDNIFSTKMISSSAGIVTVQTALAVRNETTVPGDITAVPNLTGTWTTGQNSIYQINSQEGDVFSGKITVHGKTTFTPFAGYIDKINDDGTVELVMLCVKGNFILGNVNMSTHNITVPYVLYVDGRISSTPHDTAGLLGTNMSYNVTQEHATVLDIYGITEDVSEKTRLLSMSDENIGRYNLTSTSDNIIIIGIAQEDNSFIEYSPQTGLSRGFVKGHTKYNFRAGPDLAEVSVHNFEQNKGEE